MKTSRNAPFVGHQRTMFPFSRAGIVDDPDSQVRVDLRQVHQRSRRQGLNVTAAVTNRMAWERLVLRLGEQCVYHRRKRRLEAFTLAA